MNISIDQLNLLTLNVGLAHHNADWNWHDVSSPFTRIYLVTEGEASIVFPTGTYHLRKGYLYIIPAYTRHSYICKSRFSHYYLHLYEDREYSTSLFEKYDFPVEVKAYKADEQLMERMVALAPELKLPSSDPKSYDNRTTFIHDVQRLKQYDMAGRMEMRGINMIFISRFLPYIKEKPKVNDERIKQVLDYISQNINEDISVEQICQQICLSRGYFIALFKNTMGISPQQYVSKIKVERAQLLLLTTPLSIKQIAYELGFVDHSYFTRLFHKVTGFTPQQYRGKNQI